MNLAAFSLPLCATLCLAADTSNISSNPKSKTNYQLDTIEKSAYEVGCEFAKLSGILVTATEGEKVSMTVNVQEFRKIVEGNPMKKNVLPKEFPEMFNMELLKQELLKWGTETIAFRSFHWILSDCALTSEAKIVADVAILKWIVQTIDNRNADQVVGLTPYDVRLTCSLSLTAHTGKDYIADIAKVLDEIPKLLPVLDANSESAQLGYIVDSLLALLKQLASDEICAKLESIIESIFLLIIKENRGGVMEPVPLFDAFGFYCIVVLGKGHPLIAKLAKMASKERFADWIEKYLKLSTENGLKIYSLGSWMRLVDYEFSGVWNYCKPNAEVNPDHTLNWTLSEQSNSLASDSFICINYNVYLPDSIWKEFKSCGTLEEFQNYLKKPETVRLLFVYETSIWQRKISDV